MMAGLDERNQPVIAAASVLSNLRTGSVHPRLNYCRRAEAFSI